MSKTTINGLVLGLATALEPYVTNGEIDLSKDWLQIIIALLLVIQGYSSEDSNSSIVEDLKSIIVGGRPNDR